MYGYAHVDDEVIAQEKINNLKYSVNPDTAVSYGAKYSMKLSYSELENSRPEFRCVFKKEVS